MSGHEAFAYGIKNMGIEDLVVLVSCLLIFFGIGIISTFVFNYFVNRLSE